MPVNKTFFNAKLFGEAVNEYRLNHSHDCGCDHCPHQNGVRDASKEIGISTATLSRVERGQPPSIENFAKICKWMGASTDAWLGQFDA